jgi:hypothetical protein
MAATSEELIHGLEGRLTWRTAAIALGVIVLSNVAMAVYLLPNIQARRPQAVEDGFPVMIDLEPLSSADEIYRVFDLYSPDILGLVRLLYALDFVMPLAFAVVLAVLIGKLLRYLGVKAGGWRASLLLPFAALPFDYTENVLALVLSSLYQDGQVFPTLARVAGVATAVKFLCLALTGLALVALLLRAAVKRVNSRASAAPGS